jgi:small-conductance mechanosensitive channel
MFHKLIKNSNVSNYTFMHDTRYLFNAQLKVQTTTVELTRLLHRMMLV